MRLRKRHVVKKSGIRRSISCPYTSRNMRASFRKFRRELRSAKRKSLKRKLSKRPPD
jgi:hypothetical protein